jgi:hypothetical protein
MSNAINIIEYDIVYLSYDEPNAEKNYADLLTKVPWAKRVHGVKGSDAAHKACARLAETERFITIDGDNIVRPDFVNQVLEVEELQDLSGSVISWCGHNVINGLLYGNGGIKCWPTQFVLDMKTHENADPNNPHSQVDFCWDINYIQMNGCFSDVYNNATPWQAWRAGFREGVKMSLDRGVKLTDTSKLSNDIHWKNYHRLLIWMNVGADVDNGLWAMYGARLGCYMTNLTDWDYVNVRDFTYLNKLWKETVEPTVNNDNLLDKCIELGTTLSNELSLPVAQVLSAEQSKFFKEVYKNPVRVPQGISDPE